VVSTEVDSGRNRFALELEITAFYLFIAKDLSEVGKECDYFSDISWTKHMIRFMACFLFMNIKNEWLAILVDWNGAREGNV